MGSKERLLVYGALVALFACQVRWLREAAADGPAEKIIARSFILVDAAGKPLGALMGGEDGGALYLMNARNEDAAEISARNGAGCIFLFDHATSGTARVQFEAKSSVPQVDEGKSLGFPKGQARGQVYGGITLRDDDAGRMTMLLPSVVSVKRGEAVKSMQPDEPKVK